MTQQAATLLSNLDTLCGYVLPELPPSVLVELRGTCRALFDLLDGCSGEIWSAAAVQLVPVKLLPSGEDGRAIQAVLRQQGALSARLTSGISGLSASVCLEPGVT